MAVYLKTQRLTMNKNPLIICFALLLLCGCVSNQPKVVHVPVPISCPKPVMPDPPHDYMADLTPLSTAPEFVKACLGTRESYKIGYDNCVHIMDGYKQ
jgi:hypothetical protein